MTWSWKIGQPSGIDLRIHATFLLFLGWVWATYWIAGKSVSAMLAGAGFAAALFVCIALHELSHTVAARLLSVRVKDITLLPIGGVPLLERVPEDPRRELWVALAGPAANVAIAAVLYGWLVFSRGPFVERLFLANLALALFNLIPAFPLDGARVLRALLASRVAYASATRLAASAGQGLALAFGFIGLFTSPLLVFVGLILWIGANQEASAAQMRSALSSTPVRAAMLTEFDELWGGDTLADAVRLALHGSQHDFPVVEHGRVKGILTRNDLLVALAEHGQDYPLSAVMRREFMVADADEMLDLVFRRLRLCSCHTMPVLHDGRLVGLMTMENLGEYLLAEAATTSDYLERFGAIAGDINFTRAQI
jgi:Zn-dependent protease/CBS domain-containing protein